MIAVAPVLTIGTEPIPAVLDLHVRQGVGGGDEPDLD